jgi:hypothetical protein
MDVFVHIPKSSGSTIRSILSRQYGVQAILYFEPNSGEWKHHASSPEEFLHQQMAQHPIYLITGHEPFGIHKTIRQPCRYFSMVRDPIDRALSDYYYAFSFPGHRFRREITSGKVSVDEYLTTGQYAYGYEQAAMLAGNCTSLGGPVQAAIDNVLNSFVLVGTAERFNESILLVAKALGWRPPLFVRRNVTKLKWADQKDRLTLREEAHSQFKSYFVDDYEVCQAVDLQLSKLIEREGATFAHALGAFAEIQNEIEACSGDRVFDLYEFRDDDRLPDFVARLIDSKPYKVIESYLKSPDTNHFSNKNYVGRIEMLSRNVIQGWAGDLSNSGPIEVTVWCDGNKIAKVNCDIPRPDLTERFGKGPQGFYVELDEIVDNVDYAVTFERSTLCLSVTGS